MRRLPPPRPVPLSDVTPNGAGRIYWASSGTITINNISKTAIAIIDSNVTTMNFREIDISTGVDVAGGCTTSIYGLAFWLKQETTALRAGPAAIHDVTGEILPAN